MHSTAMFDPHAGREMIVAVNRLELDWKLLNSMSQYRLLVVNIPIPFKAIDIDHALLAGSSSKCLFIARYMVRFAFNQ